MKAALTTRDHPFKPWIVLVQCLEKGRWQDVQNGCQELGMGLEETARLYNASIVWTSRSMPQ